MPRTRSSMFFVSDVYDAAEGCVGMVMEHGLTPEQGEELTRKVEALICEFFAALDDGEGADNGDR